MRTLDPAQMGWYNQEMISLRVAARQMVPWRFGTYADAFSYGDPDVEWSCREKENWSRRHS